MTNEIEEIHDWKLEGQARKNALESAAGHPWALHGTESGMCMAELYVSLRMSVQYGSPMPVHVRWRDEAS